MIRALRTFRTLILLGCCLLGSPVVAQAQQPAGFADMVSGVLPEAPVIRVDSLRHLMAQQQVTLLDSRGKQEYQVSHLPGARWVGFASFEKETMAGVPRHQPVVVYCSVGYRSGKITQQLQALGYHKVCNLWGGLFAWANQGYPLVAGGDTVHVAHPYNQRWGQWLVGAKHAYR